MLPVLLEKLDRRTAKIGIIGIGYVGLPLAVSFGEAGFDVVGIDLREEKVRLINEGRSHLLDVTNESVSKLRKQGRISASTSFESLAEVDVSIVCVPTPLAEGQPDLSRVVFAGEEIGKVLRRGSLFVLESTTYPGTTEDLLQPLLEAGGLKQGTDFMLAYSPERIDPGNATFSVEDIPKIVGGVDKPAAEAAAALYRHVVPEVVVVSGTREAEMAKLIENTFRHVNIALVNELAMYSNDLGVDIWEAIGAAATKPFGYMPFWPGPGWGGHCIPLDPTFLSWRVRQSRSHEVRFIGLAQAINAEMPRFVLERTASILNQEGKPIKGSKILGIGVAYKPNTADTRGSPGLTILGKLAEQGASVSYNDPLVSTENIGGQTVQSVSVSSGVLEAQDLILIFVRQSEIDWGLISESSTTIFDCCNALGLRKSNIHRL